VLGDMTAIRGGENPGPGCWSIRPSTRYGSSSRLRRARSGGRLVVVVVVVVENVIYAWHLHLWSLCLGQRSTHVSNRGQRRWARNDSADHGRGRFMVTRSWFLSIVVVVAAAAAVRGHEGRGAGSADLAGSSVDTCLTEQGGVQEPNRKP